MCIEFPVYNYDCTVAGYLSGTTQAIFAFSSNSIIITDGWAVLHWDGSSFIPLSCMPMTIWKGTISKFWGTSLNNFYAVGRNGMIAYFNGSWQKIESGTTLDIQDIWGATDPTTHELQIIAVATRNYPLDKTILQIQGTSVTSLSTDSIQYELFSTWFVPNHHYYVVGDGIYEKSSLSEKQWKNNPLDITHYATTKIRANGLNDIFVVGAFGEVLHYNGSSWVSYRSHTALNNGAYSGLAVKGIAVGGDGSKAIIAVGRR
jgi:hypothetical protein